MVGDQDQVGIKLWSREFVRVDVDDPPRALQAEGIVAEPRDSHRIQHHSRPVLGPPPPRLGLCGRRSPFNRAGGIPEFIQGERTNLPVGQTSPSTLLSSARNGYSARRRPVFSLVLAHDAEQLPFRVGHDDEILAWFRHTMLLGALTR